jgi:hypothetical protein
MKSPKATKRIRKAPRKRTKPDDKEAATTYVAAAPQVENVPVAEAPGPEPTTATAAQPKAKPADLSARTAAIRRSTEGKFNKVILTQIGGAECPRFYPMTWKERDAYMAKPECGTKMASGCQSRKLFPGWHPWNWCPVRP